MLRMRVFLTGASGYIGTAVLDAFARAVTSADPAAAQDPLGEAQRPREVGAPADGLAREHVDAAALEALLAFKRAGAAHVENWVIARTFPPVPAP